MKIKEMEMKRIEIDLKNKQIQNNILEIDLIIKEAEYNLKLKTPKNFNLEYELLKQNENK